MCGMFGVISGENRFLPASKYIKDCFLAGQVRGQDSAGMLQISAGGNLLTHRLAVAGTTFLQDSSAAKLVDDADDAWATFGHNRHATTGGKTYRAAHPFSFFDEESNMVFAGMHNGTLTGWDSTKFISDTHWAMDKLHKEGVEAVKKMYGAYAFFWTDTQDDPNVINFIRNKERPMHMAFAKDKKVALFASEPGMLYWLAARNDISLEEETVLALEVDTHYQFNIKDARKYTTTKIEKAAYTPASTSSSSSSSSSSSGYNSGVSTYADRSTSIIKAVRDAFTSEGATVSSGTSGTSPAAGSIGPVAGPSQHVVTGNMVTQKEIRAARDGQLYLKEVNFVPDSHDPVANVYYGSVTADGLAPTYAEIRNIHPTLLRQLDKCEVALCKVIGVSSVLESSSSLEHTDMLVLSKPYELLMEDSTIVDRRVSTGIDEATLEEEVAAQEKVSTSHDKTTGTNATASVRA